jgi:hypothetical protein
LQTLFLTRIASLKYELHLLGFQLPEAVPVYQREYDLGSAPVLGEMADAIEDKPMKVRLKPYVVSSAAGTFRLRPRVTAIFRNQPRLIHSFVTLFREIDCARLV